MLIYRTDSDRTPREDERTKMLKLLLEYKFDKPLDLLFNGINDHKGGLLVYWKVKPDQIDMEHVNTSWRCFHENFIEHYYHGESIQLCQY